MFDDVFVPEGHLVGLEGHGLKAALTSLTLGRVGIGACGVGIAQAAFDYAADYKEILKHHGVTVQLEEESDEELEEVLEGITSLRRHIFRASVGFPPEGNRGG